MPESSRHNQHRLRDRHQRVRCHTGAPDGDQWQEVLMSLDRIISSLKAFGSKCPLISLALKDVYPASTSINS